MKVTTGILDFLQNKGWSDKVGAPKVRGNLIQITFSMAQVMHLAAYDIDPTPSYCLWSVHM